MLKQVIKNLLPTSALALIQRYRVERQLHRYRGMSEKEIFDDIYSKGAWGASAANISSGSGSGYELSQYYEAIVSDFIDEHDIRTVLDFGCGDFQVGKRIFERSRRKPVLTGIDISKNVIEHNKFKYAHSEFNFIEDDGRMEVPVSELITMKQVLQHNSNSSIQKILGRVKNKYDWIIIAEHVPANPVSKNVNLQTSMATRMICDSGVFVEEAPFFLPVEKVDVVDWEGLGLSDGQLRITFSSRESSLKKEFTKSKIVI